MCGSDAGVSVGLDGISYKTEYYKAKQDSICCFVKGLTAVYAGLWIADAVLFFVCETGIF